MKNRDKIKEALIFFIEEDMRIECRDKKITSKKSIDDFIKISRNKIEQSAEVIIQEYENYLLKKVSDEIVINLKDSLEQDKLTIKDLVNTLVAVVNNNHSTIKKDVAGIYELQRRIRMQVLEEDIETIQLDLKILRKHQSILDKIAKSEAKKVSWVFVSLSMASVSIWSYLIFFKFDWDSMEPWTYISLGVVAVFLATYYAIFERNFTSESIQQQKYEKMRSHNYHLYKFDSAFLERIERLMEEKSKELKILVSQFDIK